MYGILLTPYLVAGRMFSKVGATTHLEAIQNLARRAMSKHRGDIDVAFQWNNDDRLVFQQRVQSEGLDGNGRSKVAGGRTHFPALTWLPLSCVWSLVTGALQAGSTTIFSLVPGDSTSFESQAQGVVSVDAQLADNDTECETDIESDSEVLESLTQNILFDSPAKVEEDLVEQPDVISTPLDNVESDDEEPTFSAENDICVAVETIEQGHAEQSDIPLTPHKQVHSDSEVPRSPAQETSLVAAPKLEQVVFEQSDTTVTHHNDNTYFNGKLSTSRNEDDDIFNETSSTLGQEDYPEQVIVEQPDTTAYPHNGSFVSKGKLSTSRNEIDYILNEILSTSGHNYRFVSDGKPKPSTSG